MSTQGLPIFAHLSDAERIRADIRSRVVEVPDEYLACGFGQRKLASAQEPEQLQQNVIALFGRSADEAFVGEVIRHISKCLLEQE